MAAAAAIHDNSGLWLPGGAPSSKEDKIEKWWEVNRKHDPPLDRGATPLVERCMRVLGWNEIFAKRTLKGYRQFMELKSVMHDWQDGKLSAPIVIQQMWEQHLLDNLNYTDDCFLLFGRVIGHDPDAILNERSTMDRIKTTKIAFQARYGGDLDPDVWDYGNPDSEAHAIDVEDGGIHHHHNTHHGASVTSMRGRLPVAGIAAMAISGHGGNGGGGGGGTAANSQAAAGSMSPRPRSVNTAAAVEDESPITNRPASPLRQTARSVATAASVASKATPRSPKSPSGNDPITIFLRDSTSGEETYFSLRYRSTLRIVFTVFAERKGLNQEALKFSFNGQGLTGYETPYSLGLEDRARIDVQIGQR